MKLRDFGTRSKDYRGQQKDSEMSQKSNPQSISLLQGVMSWFLLQIYKLLMIHSELVTHSLEIWPSLAWTLFRKLDLSFHQLNRRVLTVCCRICLFACFVFFLNFHCIQTHQVQSTTKQRKPTDAAVFKSVSGLFFDFFLRFGALCQRSVNTWEPSRGR